MASQWLRVDEAGGSCRHGPSRGLIGEEMGGGAGQCFGCDCDLFRSLLVLHGPDTDRADSAVRHRSPGFCAAPRMRFVSDPSGAKFSLTPELRIWRSASKRPFHSSPSFPQILTFVLVLCTHQRNEKSTCVGTFRFINLGRSRWNGRGKAAKC